MIGRLRGQLLAKQPPRLLVDVQGVGYEVEAPMTTFYALPETGSEVTLHTHLLVREDAQILFGFGRQAERDLFRHLIRINGVGPRLALAIMSGMTLSELISCINDRDAAALTRVPGIGRKTAERLLVDLGDRLKDFGAAPEAAAGGEAGLAPAPAGPVEEAVSALIALGYKPPEASRMVRAIEAGDLPAEEIIRQALRATTQKG
ncbi:Holliday junction resolvasome, DNA-binding subunit [Thiohalobacter thiocyanaticus]|uniref:Holliday junction branch migration complex subunit RuvA n=1 Tax=Thiohalobacter thiocyanaticus TaxID=585455 RepID=A0A1Z4VPG7_9GAMM|nr:Holliday junction branch migration protein RuvA [Thiohalobacter thiocyanaticus]BAZ93491.1 Holliday junction resolvasome, DNA-binding subunit [Thiohalobacter thiocyanaticus]